ncbi:hypothetical protein [Pontibacillus litoralis]|uniref:Uncharacterized protein n=1 Tax=Pontibacillus litoralis JSM 072002 TaxID=1385512 RepID=A0A0A5FVL1_9BACI|nr:hypothetical protein [Pontibacillus litoralis]KGX84841.1 hypothetical protein N784_11735 [Pontibacillus litoralis JSM 072002]
MKDDNTWNHSVYETYLHQQEQKDHFLNQLANIIIETTNEKGERE